MTKDHSKRRGKARAMFSPPAEFHSPAAWHQTGLVLAITSVVLHAATGMPRLGLRTKGIPRLLLAARRGSGSPLLQQPLPEIFDILALKIGIHGHEPIAP